MINCRFSDGLEDFKLALEQYDDEGDDDEEEENEDVPRYKIYHRKAYLQVAKKSHISINTS